MKLSTKGRYAVMAMADIAAQKTGSLVPLLAISERQDISLSYLEQLFNRLRKAGLVSSVRGSRGGYKLALAAENILISQIMDAVAEPVSATRCDSGSDHGCRGNERCITHDLWSELDEHINGFLSSVSLADVIANSPCGTKTPLTRLTTKAQRAAQMAGLRAKAG
jgi:Rrf2 family iron-sulfur cluster assembly transcriptional regulator